MLSVADIPLAGFRFTGVIALIRLRGKEYRLATYLGAWAVKIRAGEIVVRQGGDQMTACLMEPSARSLRAPRGGAMTRTIRESAACRAAYRFQRGGKTLLNFETDRASFEYEYGR